MRKLNHKIQCEDLIVHLEDGLAAIDVELGSPSDVIITGGSSPHLLIGFPKPSISSAEMWRNFERELQLALSVRAGFEKGEIAEDQDAVLRAIYDAEHCGDFSFGIGSLDAPTLLASIPALKAAWERGWDEADYSAEIAEQLKYPEPDF